MDCYATPTNDPLRVALDMPDAELFEPALTTDEVLNVARRFEAAIVVPPDLAPRFAWKGVTVPVEGRRTRRPGSLRR